MGGRGLNEYQGAEIRSGYRLRRTSKSCACSRAFSPTITKILRNILKKVVLGLCFVGFASLFYVLIGTLNPSEKAKADIPRVDISEIHAGQFLTMETPFSGVVSRKFNFGISVYKDMKGNVQVWTTPVNDGKVGMPDVFWWRPFYECSNFGPKIENGRVKEDSFIECRDLDVPEGWKSEWKWNLVGENQGNWTKDMLETIGVINGDYFVFHKSS